MLLLLMLLTLGQTSVGLAPSELFARPGHYPHIWCQLSDVALSAKHAAFYYVPTPGLTQRIKKDCEFNAKIWPIQELPEGEADNVVCDEEYEEGHAFTIFYYYGISNYFHLQFDMTIPLYQALYYNNDQPTESVVLMPTVETSRLKELDWDTDAFKQSSKYWMQIMRPLLTDNTILMPLDRSFLNTSSTVCFKRIYFGTPKYRHYDGVNPDLIQSYVKYMKSQLYVLERPLTIDDLRVGLISRSSRRRILNEEDLVEAVRPFANIDIIRFESLSVREQVALTQRYAVIIGMNGAGLMNALFRPEHAVAIQLVPYEAELNYKEFSSLLAAVGPEMVWHNKHKSLHRPVGQGVSANSQASTIVHVGEFKQLVEEALTLVKNALLGIKDEL